MRKPLLRRITVLSAVLALISSSGCSGGGGQSSAIDFQLPESGMLPLAPLFSWPILSPMAP